MSLNITMYTRANCPNCVAAKQLLKSKGLEYEEADFERLGSERRLLLQAAGIRQMPQIFINGQRVGGFAGLQAALKQLGL